jgi:glyoxylase-like metal-dependent hydrolase (beta-lactamase superfamily II)
MSADIPFVRTFELPAGQVEVVAPGIRRLVAPNPGPMTFTGTVTYVIGRGQVAIIDPGPDSDAHIAALLTAVRNETVTHIFVTHTHRDHSPAVPRVKQATGALVLAEGPHRAARPLNIGELNPLDASSDTGFMPERKLADGEVIEGSGWALEAVATPGHTANHMAYALRGTDTLFSGDHVMGWATSIVAPPDGSMRDYMQSLFKLRARSENIYLPGHGGTIRNAQQFVQHFIEHREAREAAILRKLSKDASDIASLVQSIYIGLDPRLTGAASLSVLAHLEDLVARGVVATNGPPSISGLYRLVVG